MLEKLLKEETDNLFIQLFRYTFVGGTAFIVDFGALYILTDIVGIYYLISAALAFLLGLTTNYILSVIWVFNKRRFETKWVEIAFFAVIGGVGLGLNELFIFVFTSYAGLYYLLSKLISTTLVYLWNFFARKYLLFN